VNKSDKQPIERNLAMELVRVTEAAAMAATRYLGQGDKNLVDGAAVDAMRHTLEGIRMDGIVVIGEGEKDEAPMLYNGEEVGDGSGPEVDFAVDPVDGTTLTAKSLPNALAIVAVAERHTMFDPGRVSTRRRSRAPRTSRTSSTSPTRLRQPSHRLPRPAEWRCRS